MTTQDLVLRVVPIRWMVHVPLAELESVVHPVFREHAKISHRSLVFSGETGKGKTAGVVLALRRFVEARERYVRVTWAKARSLSIAPGDFDESEEVRARCERAVDAAILVLDDLGHEPNWGLILEVLDRRADLKRITLVTTGLTPQQLDERYPSGLVRRVLESGRENGKIVHAPSDEWEAPWLKLPVMPSPSAVARETHVFTKEEQEQQIRDIEKFCKTIGRRMPPVTP